MFRGLPRWVRHVALLVSVGVVLMAAWAGVAQASQVTQPTVTFASPSGAAGARTVYTIAFNVSSSGALSGSDQIAVNFPANTGLGTVVNSIVTDTTTSTQVGSCFGSNTTTLTCFLSTGDSIPAGHGISIELDGVTNPPAATVTLTVATTSDTTTSNPSAGYTITTAGQVSQPSVALSSLTPGAGNVTYTIGFTTSGTGALSNTADSGITVDFPTNTGLGTVVNSIVTDTTTSTQVGSCFGSNTTTLTCFLSTGDSIPAGHGISIELDGVTNPPTISPSDTVQVATTSDTGSVTSASYQQGAPPPTVTRVNPSSGPPAGGTVVTITGTNLASASAVTFGSTPATSFTVDGDTQITATSPPGSGTVDVTVTTPAGGTSRTSAADQFSYASSASTAPPSVTPGSPAAQSSTSAALSGSIDPNGLLTTAYFEYGIDPSDRGPGSSPALYDQTTPAQQVGSDSSTHAISAPLSGLVPNALYHVRLVASNSAGTTVGRDQTFTTPASAPPPPPVLGQAVNVSVVSGQVFIEPPPGKTLSAARDSAALSKGMGFVPLTEARQIPTGSEIDALHGSLKMVSNTGQVGKTQTATLTGGVFKVTQTRKGITKGMADFSLVESAFQGAPSYGTCTAKHKASDATIARLSSKTLQLLKVSGHGKFKTTGRYASATVRGTIYTVADRCDGTLTHVIRDTVLVDDFVRHTTILLHTGQSYLARAIASGK
jgi:hypothetical protein